MTGELNYPNGILVHQYSIKSGNLNSKQKKIACVEKYTAQLEVDCTRIHSP